MFLELRAELKLVDGNLNMSIGGQPGLINTLKRRLNG